ncbi:hypothetical protein Q7689_33600, partial [Nocardiopsis tropica]|nr:hypothetical protein [Nocardiopsis tropica]
APGPVRRGGPAGRGQTACPAPPDPVLDQVMPRGSEQDLYRRLAPVLRAARARDDFAPAVALARELGRRARSLPDLGDQLVAAIRHDPSGATAAEAADLYLAGPGLRAGALALFRSDHATALVPRVWDVLSRHHAPGIVHAALGAAEARRGHGRPGRTGPGHGSRNGRRGLRPRRSGAQEQGAHAPPHRAPPARGRRRRRCARGPRGRRRRTRHPPVRPRVHGPRGRPRPARRPHARLGAPHRRPDGPRLAG